MRMPQKHVASSVSFRMMVCAFAMPTATLSEARADRIEGFVRGAIARYVNDAPDAGSRRDSL